MLPHEYSRREWLEEIFTVLIKQTNDEYADWLFHRHQSLQSQEFYEDFRFTQNLVKYTDLTNSLMIL